MPESTGVYQKTCSTETKSSSVPLNENMEAKLCGFEVPKVKVTASSKSGSSGSGSGGSDFAFKGMVRWMAPELPGKRPQYSTGSDIYALGMVM
ncbi:hypothetical protein DFQ27_002458 [Actinomortierella ambigua]|uniref:Protein kinase domain-containing protein n=1 Tax=Actinomortierella ambigua TaxID=1343610 RepID=A0A9P6QBY5_9FUNG|nr:hypothetical protein DFQ27_002458 [Actinomortierella ambigua]